MIDLTTLESGELIALTRALHEARFPEVENDPAVFGAPFVARLHGEAIAEYRRRLEVVGDVGGVERLDSWLQWHGRPEEVQVIRRLREGYGHLLDGPDGPEFLRSLLWPFVLDEDDVDRIMSAVDHGD